MSHEPSRNMPFSASRGIMYTAPPTENDRTEKQKAADGGTGSTAASTPADD